MIAINGDHEVNNGMHVIEGNGGATNFRTMSVSGNIQLRKGDYASVFVFSEDNYYRVQTESGLIQTSRVFSFLCRR